MISRELHIGVETPKEALLDFAKTGERLECGENVESRETLGFEDVETLFRVMTPLRWKLLRVLRRVGPKSIRGLAKEMNRDYKQIFDTVKVLERIGLISRTEDGKQIIVPFDRIVTQIDLAA